MMKVLALVCLITALAHAEEEAKDANKLGTIIGIDLGTTYSWLAKLLFLSLLFV